MTEGTRGLLDTSVVILLGDLADSAILPDRMEISAVTLAELTVGPLIAASPEARAIRLRQLQHVEAEFEPLPFDVVAARAFGRVALSFRARGGGPAARSSDAMIAATALARDLPLYTCNPADFAGIDGLTVVAVPHPDAEPA